MANFDITRAAARAYQTSWAERRYLVKMALVPFLLKCVCYLLAFSYGQEDNYLRLTLCMLPAYFAEGWMLSHYTRLLFLGHRWPFRPSGDFQQDIPLLRTRARGIMSGLLVYVLINMAIGFMLSFIIRIMPTPGTDPSDIPDSLGFLLIMVLAFSFWGFRLVWLYIPYAVNMDASYYLHALRGPLSSLSIIGVWLMCIMPFFLLVQIPGSLLHHLMKDTAGDTVASFIFIILLMGVDTVKNIISTAGVGYGLQEVLGKDKAR